MKENLGRVGRIREKIANINKMPSGLRGSNKEATSEDVSLFPGAEKHVHTKTDSSNNEHRSTTFEYFTQHVDGGSSEGWKEMVESGMEAHTLAVIDNDNILAWAQDKFDRRIYHSDLVAAQGKDDISQTRIVVSPTRIVGTPFLPTIQIVNPRTEGIECVKPLVDYFKQSYGDLADKIEVDYDGIEPDGSALQYKMPLSKF